MVVVTLPDGSKREYPAPLTVFEVAQSIGTGLAKAALAGKVNGKLVDTSFLINSDSDLAIVTDKDPEGLEVIRHSTAHLLAYAVKELFPDAQVTIGPVIDNGFYYDFDGPHQFTLDDLPKIEAKMRELPMIADVSSDLQLTNPQITVELDRDRISAMGFTADGVEQALAAAFSGAQISTIFMPNNQYAVMLRVSQEFQQDDTALSQIQLKNPTGGLVPISSESEYVAQSPTELPEDKANDVLKLVDALEQDDDVQRVFHNLA